MFTYSCIHIIILYHFREMTDKKLVNGMISFNKEEYDDYQKSLSSEKEWPGINVNAGKIQYNIIKCSYS